MRIHDYIIPMFKEKSPYFKCPNCGYTEARLVKGDVAYSPCPRCGHSPLHRVQ